MTDSGEPYGADAVRLQEIAAELATLGLVTRLHRTRAGTDLTATLHPHGCRELQVIVDEDGYTELRYWASLVSAPAAAVATIANVLELLTASQSLAGRVEPTWEPVAGYDGAVTERAEGSGMTGPHDHLAEHGQTPDQARPRSIDDPHDARVRPDDLQVRLERLPLNHPSSPFRDDGSRKPPPPDLAKYEIPPPHQSDPPPHPDLATEGEPRVDPDGSWTWKSYRLTSEQSRGADQGLTECREMEGRDIEGRYSDHGLTPAMRRIEPQLDHGELVTDTEKI